VRKIGAVLHVTTSDSIYNYGSGKGACSRNENSTNPHVTKMSYKYETDIHYIVPFEPFSVGVMF
jgi:hypothetical protein